MQSEESSDLTSLVGKLLGQFRLIERLGSGGMSTVFKGYQSTLDRYVAIKVLPTNYAQDPMFLERFRREARSVAKLAHPNIVQIYDFGEQQPIFYIVMEYVDGGTLAGKLRQGALPVSEASDFIIQAAGGLEYAHRQGIVHRDVKPANMLLRKDGHLLLSDFGIASILGGTTELTSPGTLIGTPIYVSPEQGSGQPVDRRSDIYSLGIVFFQCLTGRAPFVGDSPLALIVQHINVSLPVDDLRSMNVPAPIVQVVLKMTAKIPADRYSSAQGVIDALTEALATSHIALPRTRSGEQETVLPFGSQVNQQRPSPEQPSDFTNNTESPGQIGVVDRPPQLVEESASPSTVLFTDAVLPRVDLKDFFIIYSRSDRSWARWIAWELENAGYSTVLPAWSFQHDSDFELEVQKAAAKAQRTVILLSSNYLKAFGSQSAGLSLFQKAVTGKQSSFLPICVRDCGVEFSLLLDSIDYIDLVGEDEPNARMILLASVREEGIKLTTAPVFPGNTEQNTFDTMPGFPNRQFMTQARFEAAEADPSTYISPLHPPHVTQGVKVFFSYAHKDKKLRSELDKYLNHLKRQQVIVGWYDGEIEAGKEWAQEINQHLSEAQIILLLISQDFMASEYCYDIEMQKALQRHDSGEAHVIPIILRPAMWESSPIGKLQALPTGAKPIIMWSNRELAFLDVAKGIQKAIDQLKSG